MPLERRPSKQIITPELAERLNRAGRDLLAKTKLGDLAVRANTTKNIPTPFLVVEGEDFEKWHAEVRGLDYMQNKELTASLNAALRKEYITVGDIRDASEEELRHRTGLGELRAGFLIEMFREGED